MRTSITEAGLGPTKELKMPGSDKVQKNVINMTF